METLGFLEKGRHTSRSSKKGVALVRATLATQTLAARSSSSTALQGAEPDVGASPHSAARGVVVAVSGSDGTEGTAETLPSDAFSGLLLYGLAGPAAARGQRRKKETPTEEYAALAHRERLARRGARPEENRTRKRRVSVSQSVSQSSERV